MLCFLRLAATLAIVFGCTSSLSAQEQQSQQQSQQSEQQSLGDIARKYREQKGRDRGAAPPLTFTQDDVVSGHILGVDASSLGKAAGGTGSAAAPDPTASFQRAEAVMSVIAGMDRATLVKVALQGADTDFPGRKSWEERLLAARNSYVTQGTELIQQIRAAWAAAKALNDSQHGNVNPSDSQAQAILNTLRNLAQQAARVESDFQAVITEGRNLAKRPSHN